ncbi:S24 family peptidase [Vibrio vulnificus]|uniref:S24 family peptidase n=1 Tax=Vibrio vulnificus TaxID=672 RepID=UPI003EDB21E0
MKKFKSDPFLNFKEAGKAMNKHIDYKGLIETDGVFTETDPASVSQEEKRTEWFIASELSGKGNFPQSDRWTRDALKELALEKPHLCRKRKGTKAYEYHISLLPKEVQAEIFGGDKVSDISEPKSRYAQKIYADFNEEYAMIPGYRVQVSAGHGSIAPETERPVRYLAFRRKWLKHRGFSEKDLTIVWANGDSMEPTIHNNDTLVVHLGRNKPQDGHIYIFRNEDQLFVKRYQNILGAWRLISDNKIYDKVDIKKEDQHQFEVVGQVVHIAKDIGD